MRHPQTKALSKRLLIAFAVCLLCLLWVSLGRVKSQATGVDVDPCGSSSPSRAASDDFELVPQQFSTVSPQQDTNGFLLNPQWGWQTHHLIADGAKPKLDNFPDSFDDVRCRNGCFRDCIGKNPKTDADVPPRGPMGCLMCNVPKPKPNRLLGHVNWFAATYTGTICFHNCSYPDMDYTFSLIPKGWAGLTRWNAPSKHDDKKEDKPPRVFHVEFDSLETVIGFQSKKWSEFRDLASPCDTKIDKNSSGNFYKNSCKLKEARNRIKQKRAVVIGLLGLDSEHEIYSELHPVYAMAIEMNPDPSDNTWIVFARNAGNEGACSVEGNNHELIWPKESQQLVTRLNLLIPPPETGAVGEVVTRTTGTDFYSNNSTCPGIYQYQHPDTKYEEDNKGVLLTFDLQPCEDGNCIPLVEGEIHINWNQPAGAGAEALFRKKEEDECVEPKKEPEHEPESSEKPTSAQAARILSLLARLRSQASSQMKRCTYKGEAAIPRVQPLAPEIALRTTPLGAVMEALDMEAKPAQSGRSEMIKILGSKSH